MSVFSLPLLYSFLSGVSFSLLGLSYKIAAKHECRPTPFAFVFSLVAGVIATVASQFFPTEWGDSRLWMLGIAMGILLPACILVMVRANAIGPASVSWTVLNLALIGPIVTAPIFFHERFLWIDAALVLFFILTLLAFARGMSKPGGERPADLGRYLALVMAIFVFNGIFLIGHKIKFAMFSGVNSAATPAIFYASSAVICLLIFRLREGGRVIRVGEWKAGTMAGIASATGILLFLSSMSLPAVVTYPISQGVALLGGVFLAALIFRERINPHTALGIGLGVTVLMLAIFRKEIAEYASPFLAHLCGT